MRDFEADATASRRQIRDLLDNNREIFCDTSIEILKIAGESRGAQYLVVLLVANGMLLQALCNPHLTREEAMSLGRAAPQPAVRQSARQRHVGHGVHAAGGAPQRHGLLPG